MCDTSGSIQLSEEQKSAPGFSQQEATHPVAQEQGGGNCICYLITDTALQAFLLSKLLDILLLECVLNKTGKRLWRKAGWEIKVQGLPVLFFILGFFIKGKI